MREFDELKLARVIDACGGVDGRVKLQKIVYLLKVMGFDLPFDDFVVRQHGPFSRAVACSADVLKAAEMVSERCDELGPAPGGECVRQYAYSVRDDVARLIRQHFDVTPSKGKPPLDVVAAELKGQDRAVLEVAATRLFLEREGRLKGDRLDAELSRLKGHLSSSFAAADRFLADLRSKSWL